MNRWTLEELCPDFSEWPGRWMGLPEDKSYGEGLLDAMRPFVNHLLASGLTKRVIRRHLDNLWLLGGEIIREVNRHEEHGTPPKEKLWKSVDSEGGPMCRHLASEAGQNSFDCTCRKLHGFFKARESASEKTISAGGGHARNI